MVVVVVVVVIDVADVVVVVVVVVVVRGKGRAGEGAKLLNIGHTQWTGRVASFDCHRAPRPNVFVQLPRPWLSTRRLCVSLSRRHRPRRLFCGWRCARSPSGA